MKAPSTGSMTRKAAGRRLLLVLAAASSLVLVLGVALATATAPVVTVENAKDVGFTTAQVEGTVNPEDKETSYHFEYATQGQFETSEWGEAAQVGFNSLAAGSGATPVSEALSGLTPATVYHLRLVASNEDGSNDDVAAGTFETEAVDAPVVSNVEASEISYQSAKATGEVEVTDADPAFTAYCRFEYITNAQWEENGFAFPAEGAPATPCNIENVSGSEPQPVAVEAQLTGLEPGTPYHLRLLATNQGGTGSDEAPLGSFETLGVSAPIVVAADADAVTDTSAHFSGSVGLLDSDPAYHASCSFDYVKDAQFQASGFDGAQQVPCDPNPVTAAGSTPVQADATNLEPNSTYHLRLRAQNAGGTGTDEAPATFATDAVPPEIGDSPTLEPTQTTATIVARVNPHNSALTECRFVYGIGEAAGNEAPCEGSPSGNSFAPVQAKLTGLTPGSTYRFKLLAATAGGSEEGEEQLFLTAAVPSPPASCPNEEIRETQNAQNSGCRAYEMVTPPDKNGGEVDEFSLTIDAATDGNALAYGSAGSYGDTVGSGPYGQTQYVAQRGDAGWASRGIGPTPTYDVNVTAGIPVVFNFSDDLTRAVLYSQDLPGVSGDNPVINLYSEDTRTRALQPVTTPLAGPPAFFDLVADFLTFGPAGASADSRVIAFTARSHLLPEAPEGVTNAYSWEDGTLRLAGILPDGTIPAAGSRLASESVVSGGIENRAQGYRQTVSPDGSAILFKARPEVSEPPQLYMRLDHSRTAWVSEPETTVPSALPEEVILQQVTGDSDHVIFSSTSRLLDEDTKDGPDLYLYTDGPDPDEESNLTLISSGVTSGQVAGLSNGDPVVAGSSDDGSRIYYLIGETFWFWQEGETRRASDGVSVSDGDFRLGAANSGPGGARVSPDGRYLAFLSGRERPQMYLYDAEGDSRRCVSCLRGNPEAGGASLPSARAFDGPAAHVPGLRPSFLAAAGTVFFSSVAALVPEDTNGAKDAYGFDPATSEAFLVSPGSGSPAMFVEAGASGEDVFFLTRQRLVGSDRDSFMDIYDARVGGGYVEPPAQPAPCEGEGCQSSAQPPPGGPPIATTAAGGGNVKPCRPRKKCCRRNHAKKAKARCARKHGQRKGGHRGRTADTNRRAAR